MKITLAAAVALFIVLSILPARAADEFHKAGDFVDVYNSGRDNFLLRLYIRGVGDGIAGSNAAMETLGKSQLYCPPRTVGLVDAQYVSIMKTFLTKFPAQRDVAPTPVLLFALIDAFPCKGK